MSQNYIITTNMNNPASKPEITISTHVFEKADIKDGQLLVSAGMVSFAHVGVSGISVTHGSNVFGIPVDLEQMKLDQELLEKTFLN